MIRFRVKIIEKNSMFSRVLSLPIRYLTFKLKNNCCLLISNIEQIIDTRFEDAFKKSSNSGLTGKFILSADPFIRFIFMSGLNIRIFPSFPRKAFKPSNN